MTSPITVIQPVALTDAMLVSASLPEADQPVWSSGTTYALGDRVMRAHVIYESLAGGNLGNVPEDSPGQWLAVGPTNRWACFDGSNSTKTLAPSGSMSYRIALTGGANSFAALGLVGAFTVRVRVEHPSLGTLYDRTVDVAALPLEAGWWAWWFGERRAPLSVVLTDLPGIPGTELLVDIEGTTALGVGVLAWGQSRQVGLGVLAGARVGITDYSRKETDGYGNTVLRQRAFARRASWTTPIPAGDVDATLQYLTALRAVPCIWVGSSKYDSTVIYGFYKQLEVLIAYASMSECQLEIEGLT